MLSDFTWNMTGYIPKYAVNPHGDGIIPYMAERIFQLEPEPPAVGSLNEYILSACREKNTVTESGVFGADMRVDLSNDGPFTILLDSQEM